MSAIAPRVTVLIPVFNAGKHLVEAVFSIMRQSFEDLEVLIVDDGSTDGCLDFLADINDPRIRVVSFERNVGLIAALNRGVELALGSLIARMDADDISATDRLEKQVKMFDEDPSLALLGTWARYVDRNGRPFGYVETPLSGERIVRRMLRVNCFIHPSVMMRTDIVRSLGAYPENALHAEDYALWLRFVEQYHVANLGEYLLDYRVHPGQVSQRRVVEQFRATTLLQREAGLRFLALGLIDSPTEFASPSGWRILRGFNGTVGAVYAGWAELYRAMGDRKLAVSTALSGLRSAPLSLRLYAVVFAPILAMPAVRWVLDARAFQSFVKRVSWYEARISNLLFGDPLE